MKLLVISNAPFIKKDNHWFAYSPYVKEMEVWAKHADQIAFCCPKWKKDNGLLISEISFPVAKLFLLSDFNIKSFQDTFKAFFQISYNIIVVIKAMFWANHIHLRCPGNVGLIASVAQIFFQNKIKTAKYAGNWDPNAKKPWSYKLQKYILSNTYLTKKIQVLVYGKWENDSKNIKPFFTATYNEIDKIQTRPRKFENNIQMLFVGSLVSGKRPLYAIQIVEKLIENGLNIHLFIFGEGNQKHIIKKYIEQNSLQKNIFIKGNHNTDYIKKAYQQSHFIILPSESEGWPKVVAEGMFWGCVPLVTKISCIPYMIKDGERGVVLTMDLKNDVHNIQQLIQNTNEYELMSQKGQDWSRKYTLDYFEQEIKLLLQA